MKWPKKIDWFAHRKSGPYAYAILGTLIFVLVFFAYQDRCKRRIRVIRVNLSVLRDVIRIYSEVHGGYPNSLNEFRQWSKGDQSQGTWDKMYVDLTSDRQSNVPEYRELNDKGGYYYYPNTGEIRLNLTRPLKEYLPYYRGGSKDNVPSTW